MKSHVTHLECTYCHKTLSHGEPHRTCPECGKVLYPRYDLREASKTLTKDALKDRPSNMWRYFEVMPVLDPANVVTLGEGFTPLFQACGLGKRLGCSSLHIKDEGINPTGSFKARGLSAAVSKARELQQTRLTMPTAGNAGGAMAAYCARGGLSANVFMPKDAPEANKEECLLFGANLTLVDGFISDAGRMSREAAAEQGLFDVSTLQEPYRVEGKKTMGYELAEQFGWELPDAIVYPTGGGTGIVGMWKAFAEMEDMSWIGPKRPRMICVQSEGCAPIVRAFQEGAQHATPWENPDTLAAGIRVPAAIGDYLILQAIRDSGGTAITVSDAEILESLKEVASLEGIFACPEGAATLAGLKRLLADGAISHAETIVLMNTGSGLKYMDVIGT